MLNFLQVTYKNVKVTLIMLGSVGQSETEHFLFLGVMISTPETGFFSLCRYEYSARGGGGSSLWLACLGSIPHYQHGRE